MTSEQAIPYLACYVSGDVPPPVREAIDALIEGDPAIAELVAQLHASHDHTVRTLCEQQLPLSARSAVEHAVQRTRQRRNTLWLAVGAVVTGLVGVALLLFLTRGTRDRP